MTFKYIFDSYAWIEYFRGSKKGEIVRNLLEKGSVATPTIVIAELADSYFREGRSYFEKDLVFITAKTAIIDLTAKVAVNAGKIKNIVRERYKTKFGLADGIILATARELNARVVTGDEHFRKLKNVEYLA